MVEILTELIRRTTSDLPRDIETRLRAALKSEEPGSQAALMLGAITANVEIARENSVPMCQDTGTLTFFWKIPDATETAPLKKATLDAVMGATELGLLRKNTIDSVGGGSVDTNVGAGAPVVIFNRHEGSEIEVQLLQKGGGCENMSSQFSLPDSELGAGRDLEGVRVCILKAVHNAQGYGCAPGVLGVCIGSDRAGGYKKAKEQLLRPLDDRAEDPLLASLEERALQEANDLGIGPMGMGGKTTLLGVKIAAQTRLPASYFVTVAYMCWACRRRGVRVDGEGRITWFE